MKSILMIKNDGFVRYSLFCMKENENFFMRWKTKMLGARYIVYNHRRQTIITKRNVRVQERERRRCIEAGNVKEKKGCEGIYPLSWLEKDSFITNRS